MICTNCGMPGQTETSTCTDCGEKINMNKHLLDSLVYWELNSQNPGIYHTVVLSALIIIAGIYWFMQ